MKVAKVRILILHEKYKYHSIYLHIRILRPSVRPHFTLSSVRILPSYPSVFYPLIHPSVRLLSIRPHPRFILTRLEHLSKSVI